jgi:hypothetical protein
MAREGGVAYGCEGGVALIDGGVAYIDGGMPTIAKNGGTPV